LIIRASPEENKVFVGLSIQEAAEESGVDPWQMFFDLVEQAGGTLQGVNVSPKSMNEQQKMQALRAPFVAIGTDASPVNPSAVDASHPRAFGTFPRVLAKYVREEGIISLEEAIRKMTSLPAFDRGRISPGMVADLVIFDPMKIQDNATFTDPLLYSEGIDYSIINGVMVIEEGRYTDARPGRLLRASRESENSSSRTTTP
jgi:N-acyl-D-aspartate/D-glutamate deacylase